MKIMKNINNYEVSDFLINRIKEFEGLHDGNLSVIGLQPKLCPAGYWTYGYGILCRHNGIILTSSNCAKNDERLQQFELINEAEADKLLRLKVENFRLGVKSRLLVSLEMWQFEALICFCYNCGYSMTMFKMINNTVFGRTIAIWWETHYTTVNGRELLGLVKRRKYEANWFINGYFDKLRHI